MSVQLDNTRIAFCAQTNKALKRAHTLFSLLSSSLFTNIGIKAVRLSLAVRLPVKWIIKNTIFRQFCGGETLEETVGLTEKMGGYNVDTILDYGVEGKEDEVSFDRALPEFIKAIEFAGQHRHVPFISLKITGFARFSLLEKMHCGNETDADEREEWQRVYARIDKICSCAALHNISVLVDAEETWIQEPCNELTEAMMEKYNHGRVVVFNTFQLYCHGTLDFLKMSIERAVRRHYLLGAKLVRGAYMEKERARAKRMGYADPIQPNKEATDRDFDSAVELCLRNLDKLELFIGTHNELSNYKAIDFMNRLQLTAKERRVSFSQLLGMGDHISFNLAHAGYHVSKYVPYGPVSDVVPYLMRRAQENTSVGGQTTRELSLIRKEIQRRKNSVNAAT